MNENDVKKGGLIRQEFGAMQAMAPVETQALAMASQAKAMVEARYVMAMQRPRNWDQVRQDVLKECKRPAFARNTSAYYHKPIGKGVEGLGIRFVEVALRCMTNMLIESTMIFEDADKEIHRVSVTDLEGNVTYPLDVRCTKSVERSRPAGDGTYLSVRNNSYGKPVYTVVATDDELLNKRAALISKAVRTVGLRLIPGDIQDEAQEIILAIRQDAAAKDPDAERKALADGFAQMGVKAAELTEYLGHALDACSPPELASLRALWGAIRNGEASWAEALDNARNQRDEDRARRGEENAVDAGAKVEADTGSRTAGLAAKLKSRGGTMKVDQAVAADDGMPMADLVTALSTAKTADEVDQVRDLARGLSTAELGVLEVMIKTRLAKL